MQYKAVPAAGIRYSCAVRRASSHLLRRFCGHSTHNMLYACSALKNGVVSWLALFLCTHLVILWVLLIMVYAVLHNLKVESSHCGSNVFSWGLRFSWPGCEGLNVRKKNLRANVHDTFAGSLLLLLFPSNDGRTCCYVTVLANNKGRSMYFLIIGNIPGYMKC